MTINIIFKDICFWIDPIYIVIIIIIIVITVTMILYSIHTIIIILPLPQKTKMAIVMNFTRQPTHWKFYFILSVESSSHDTSCRSCDAVLFYAHKHNMREGKYAHNACIMRITKKVMLQKGVFSWSIKSIKSIMLRRNYGYGIRNLEKMGHGIRNS